MCRSQHDHIMITVGGIFWSASRLCMVGLFDYCVAAIRIRGIIEYLGILVGSIMILIMIATGLFVVQCMVSLFGHGVLLLLGLLPSAPSMKL